MGPGEFLNINFFTALFTLVNTVALFLVLKHFLFKPVMKMITDRQKEIDDMYDEAGAAKANAKALEAEYQKKLSVASETGERMVKEAVARGQAREEEILRKANQEAAAIMYHTVRSGDTLGRIAKNNHTTVKKLCQLNGLKKTSTLRIGQRIRVR